MPMNPSPLQPDKNPTRDFRVFHLREIYTGPSGTGAWVPNPEDLIWALSTGFQTVFAVDYTSGLSTLLPVNVSTLGGGADLTEALLAAGPGSVSSNFRIYIDDSILPHPLAFDNRLACFGSENATCKVFRGINIGPSGDVISARYDGNGDLISENLLMENVADITMNNVAVKTVTPGSCSGSVLNGDLLTAVFYTDTGAINGIYRMLAVTTDFVRAADANSKYISAIELISNYMSSSDSAVVDVPVNLTVQSAMFKGRVHYNDGSTTTLPIDGTKFSLLGLNAYMASVPDQYAGIQLVYALGPGEYASGLTPGLPGNMKNRAYRLHTIAADNAFTVKIFAIPTYDTTLPTPAWRLNYYLYNLDRQVYYNIDEWVQFPVGQPAFNGLPAAYGTEQNIQVSVNLQDIGVGLPYYYYSQILKVTAVAPGVNSLATDYFNIDYSSDLAVYGNGSYARVQNDGTDPLQKNLYINDGMLQLGDWLNSHYYNLLPLKVQNVEFTPPAPTHVRLKIGTSYYRLMPIAEVLSPILDVTIASPQGKTIRMEFVKIVGATVYELAMGYMVLKST